MNWRKLLPWFAVGALAACAPGPGPSSDVGEPVAMGFEAPDEELVEYLGELLAAARALPESGRMRGRLGMAYEANGFLDAARASYRQAETLAPDDFRWPYFAALLEARDGDASAALATLLRALAIDADYAPAWLWRGRWLLDLNRAGEAAQAFQRAAMLGAAQQEADFGRAQAFLAQGQHAQAAALLAPLTARLGHPAIHRVHGQALRALGRKDEARVALARGSEARPFEWSDERQREKIAHARGYASFDWAQELSSAGRTTEALAIFRRLSERHPPEQCGRREGFFACNLLNSTSLAYARAGRLQEALQTARQGLAMNPDFAPFQLSLASHHRQQRDFDAALRHADRAAQLNPHSARAQVQRGRALFALGRHDEAKAALAAALRLAPPQPTTLFYLGMVEAEQRNWPQAIERFSRAVRLDPGLAVGHLYLARSLGEAGRIDEARAALGEAADHGALDADIAATNRRLAERESGSALPN